MAEIKQTNFRINQDTAAAFRAFCEENGWNQAEGFDNVMRQVELNKAKNATPGRAVEIESFEKSVKDIMTAYLNSIEINNNTESRIREQFASALDSKDKTINDLQAKTAELQEAQKVAEQAAASAAQAAARAIKDEKIAKEQADTAIKLVAEKDKTIATLADKLSVAEEKVAGYDNLKKSEEKLEKDIAILTQNYNSEIKELKMEMERKISDAEKDSALSVSQAVVEKEREMMQQIRESDRENAKLLAKIEILEERIKELTEAKN